VNPMKLVHKYVNQQPRVRRLLTRMIYGRKDTDVMLFTRKVRINTVLENGYYRAARLSRTSSTLNRETMVLQRIALFYRDNMTLVDIGANVGLFSVCAADVQNLYPNFHVVAFEVNPDTFSRLEVNAKAYGFEAINCPLASEERDIEFVSGAVSGVTTTADKVNAYNIASTSFKARTRRLDSFDLKGDLFLKIDVEGQELDVLKGASRFFEEGRVKAVFIDGFDREPAVPEFLRSHGFTLVDPDSLKPYMPRHWTLIAFRD